MVQLQATRPDLSALVAHPRCQTLGMDGMDDGISTKISQTHFKVAMEKH